MKTSGTKLVVFFTVLGFVIAGCAQVPRKGGFNDVQRLVDDRVDYRLSWNQGLPEDREVQQAVDALLEKELTVDSAVQIALLNNARLQATYEELGVSQAEVVQAGLLQKPECVRKNSISRCILGCQQPRIRHSPEFHGPSHAAGPQKDRCGPVRTDQGNGGR